MRESEYTRAIGKLLPKSVYKWKISDRFTAGVPDSWYSGSDGDIWIEYKYIKKMPKKKVKPKLSALQTKWLNERHAEGRNVAVIVGSPEGGLIFTNGEWTKEKECTNLLSRQEIAIWITLQITSIMP